MIKEYFTDGLIGIAILLSLFRTDLVGINNIINYPEVQDIILGQTAAYLPANFHRIHNSLHAFGNPKHLDFDNTAFNAWFQNINNSLFQGRRDYNIEAFLVSTSHQNVLGEQYHHINQTINTLSESSNISVTSLPSLPEESANSFVEEEIISVQSDRSDNNTSENEITTVDQSSTNIKVETPDEDAYFKEEEIISVQSDGSDINTTANEITTVDQSSTHIKVETPDEDAYFKEEEIISLQSYGSDNNTAANEIITFDESSTSIKVETPGEDAYFMDNSSLPGCNLTKEDLKLIDILYQQDVDLGVGKEIFDPLFREELEREREQEFIKQQERQKVLLLAKEKEEQEKKEQKDRWLKKNFRRDGETGEWVHLWNETGQSSSRCISLPVVGSSCSEEFINLDVALGFIGNMVRPEESIDVNDFTHESQQHPLLVHQDSFDENWNSLVDYLNITADSFDESIPTSSSVVPQLNEDIDATSDLEQDADLQTEYLIQNATLPASILDTSADFSTLTPPEELNSSMPFQSANMNSTMEFDLGDLSFFSNLTTLQNASVVDINLAAGDELFQNIQDVDDEVMMNATLPESKDAMQRLNDSSSNNTGSLLSGFGETFDGLEGATGGSDYNGSYEDMNERFTKVSHLSESSNDSGFAYHHGFSSPSSSASSSYAGSPAGSQCGINSSASSNDTEHDLPDSFTLAHHHHVAHNHTYNTPPGQLPREVKKYAQKVPSRKGPQSRDQRRAEELKVPFAIDEIIESSVETFNEMLTAHKLNDAQLMLVKDIRRRGKNKVAAQNCRKRKVSVIFNLADEMTDLQKMRDRLVAERAAMDREKRKLKETFGHLYTHIFQSLRDERGEPYDPNFYSLQQSSDGNVFLVPRNLPVSGQNNSSLMSPSSSKNSTNSKKRKSFDD